MSKCGLEIKNFSATVLTTGYRLIFESITKVRQVCSVLEWGTVQSGLFRANNLESMSKCGLKIKNFRATVLATGCDDVRIQSSMFGWATVQSFFDVTLQNSDGQLFSLVFFDITIPPTKFNFQIVFCKKKRDELWTRFSNPQVYIYICIYVVIFESIPKVRRVCKCIWNIHIHASLTFGLLSKWLPYKM